LEGHTDSILRVEVSQVRKAVGLLNTKAVKKESPPRLRVTNWGEKHVTQMTLHSTPFMAQTGHSLSSMTHFYSPCQFGSLLQRHTACYSEIPTATFQKTTQIKRCML